jgi:predicted DNA-binding transcriptional regulator AlpA
MAEKYLNDREVAERYGISRAGVWRHAEKGLLPKPIKLDEADNMLKAQRDSEAA